jgi:hypothetical protein
MEKLGATLRARRDIAESAAGAASGTASAALEHGRL